MTPTTSKTPVARHWIGGQADRTPPERLGAVTESASGELVAEVAIAAAATVDRAVAAAIGAGGEWATSSISQRTRVLFAFRQLLSESREELAGLITRENGKVASDALAEVQRGLEVVDFACGVGELLKGSISTQVSAGVDSY